MRDFRKYTVWEEAIDLASLVYSICDSFPKYETFALADQLRRAVVSIPSNIAEGSSRVSDVEFAHYLEIALGSAYEVETQLLIANRRDYLSSEQHANLSQKVTSVEKKLSSFISKLRNSTN